MFRNIFGPREEDPLDDEIKAVLNEMGMIGVDAEDYPKQLGYLERLYELKTKNRRKPVSLDTVAMIAGNILTATALVAYEQKHVLTSKGFTFIRPLKD